MKKLKTICVDDEFPALQLIAEYALQNEYIDLRDKFNSSGDALSFLQQEQIDLLISDIQMPGMDGINLLNELENKPMCIFITADPSKAVTAYELDVIDYLVKPVSAERFAKAIKKALEYHTFIKKTQEKPNYLMIKSDYRIHKITITEIKRVEGMGEYIKIVTPHKNYSLLKRMSEFEKEYEDYGFVRIHKSYLVVRSQILSYKSGEVLLKNGDKLPVGRVYKGNLH